MTFYKQFGQLDQALQYCYEIVMDGDLFRGSKKWNSCVVEICEMYQVLVVVLYYQNSDAEFSDQE